MSFTFRPARRERVPLLLSLAGASGSGKTYSALTIAKGLAGPKGRIAFIDAEARRALHYANDFTFDHCHMAPPFGPDRMREAISTADGLGYEVIVIDSLSHEYEGEGGVLEMADKAAAAGMTTPKNWIAPKLKHKRMMGALLQCRAHLIFCLRAEDKTRIEKDAKGKTVIISPKDIPVKERWVPICEKRFMYEMTASFIFTSEEPGVPIPVKLQAQHRGFVSLDRPISTEVGAGFGAWANEGEDSRPAADPFQEASQAAERGTEALRQWWAGPGREMAPDGRSKRQAVEHRLDELKELAAEADRGPAEVDPFEQPAALEPAQALVSEAAPEPEAPADEAQPEAVLAEWSIVTRDGEVQSFLTRAEALQALLDEIRWARALDDLGALQRANAGFLEQLKSASQADALKLDGAFREAAKRVAQAAKQARPAQAGGTLV